MNVSASKYEVLFGHSSFHLWNDSKLNYSQNKQTMLLVNVKHQ